MIGRLISRLGQMDGSEISWRLRTASHAAALRASAVIRPPRWRREELADRLAPRPELAEVSDALRAARWSDAHDALSVHFTTRPTHFVIHPRDRQPLVDLVLKHFPDARSDAASRADRIVTRSYDLLGYRDLQFDSWHADPVHQRRAPLRYWSAVPYLDPGCGDHKIIWELNRHQHWLALGRAHWLTSEPRYRAAFVAELSSWLRENPPLVGINWASMLELAFRSISWVWALHLFVDPQIDDDTAWTVDLLMGLDRQLTHVEQNLSYYFSPNTHLLGEALALYVAGRSLPELAASTRWAATGRRILIAEAARQIAADGGHCERSTHYHRYTLDFYLLALITARATSDPIAAAFERSVKRLAAAARLLADDNGCAPHLGDDDGGMLLPIAAREADDWRDSLAIAAAVTGNESLRVGPVTEEELWMLHAVPTTADAPSRIHSAALEDTGYYISRSDALHVVIDGGPHGYRNGGHAHADALALSASYRGRPLLIDAGTACYTIDVATRDRFRASQAHNTLTLNGRSQSLPNGPFHWSTSADSVTHRWRTTDGFDYFDGSHDGYAPASHRRRVFVLHGDVMVIADHVASTGDCSAAVHWHIDPRWTVESHRRGAAIYADDARVNLVVPDGIVERFEADPAAGLGWHSPVYGRVDRATTIRLTRTATAPFWMASVFDFSAADPILAVEWLPVWAEAGLVQHSTALRLVRERAIDYMLFVEPSASAGAATWRVGEFETDARMLFCRIADGVVSRLAIVDGSTVRSSGRRSLGVALGRTVPALFIDESRIRTFTPCAASPAS